LGSVSYLVFDRIYETGATVSVVASDSNDPFKFPFSINNNSHIFSFSQIEWRCLFLYARAGRFEFHNDLLGSGTILKLPAGQNLNISCDLSGPIITTPKLKFTSAVIKISLSYKANMFSLYHWPRAPPPTIFTWIGDASNPQWVRGDFAR
jgi:hypothetical protein